MNIHIYEVYEHATEVLVIINIHEVYEYSSYGSMNIQQYL